MFRIRVTTIVTCIVSISVSIIEELLTLLCLLASLLHRFKECFGILHRDTDLICKPRDLRVAIFVKSIRRLKVIPFVHVLMELSKERCVSCIGSDEILLAFHMDSHELVHHFSQFLFRNHSHATTSFLSLACLSISRSSQ